MAMDLVTGAVGSLISKLGGLLKKECKSKIGELLNEEYKLQKGVEDKIRSLINELECVHAALRKIDGVPPDQLEEQERIWAHEVREASYDMEDALDTFLVSAQGDHTEKMDDESVFEYLKMKIANAYKMVVSGPSKRRKIVVTIDGINKRLQEATERQRRYRSEDIVSTPSERSTVDPRLVAMYKDYTELIGVKKPSAELISKLSLEQGDEASKKKMKIVSVVGIGGLGKTTLTKAVHDKVKVDFQCWAFVSIGRRPDFKKVFRDILIELDRVKYMDIKMTILDERQLIDELREYLGSKRYFIVIDDIWETKSWEKTIKLAFLENYCGSRIIITTRNYEVATAIGDVYRMQPLSNDYSRKLFYTRIFGANERWPGSETDEITNKILKKCDGVPLAIITMASLLVDKPREKWSDMFTSVGFGHKENEEVDNTMKILAFSYYDMPANLRTCLLYLSLYPEDYEINRNSLIWKWIAEGFIQGKQGIQLFELGEQYFNSLVNRSMIQGLTNSEYERCIVSSCRVHDMVLDLIRSVASKENFITILDNDEARCQAHQGQHAG